MPANPPDPGRVRDDFDLAFPDGFPERRRRLPSLRQLGRRPLTWLFVAEALVVLAFAYAAWKVVESHLGSRPPAAWSALPGLGSLPQPVPSPAAAGPSPPATAGTRVTAGPTPGLSRTVPFGHRLNSDYAAWYDSEWRLTSVIAGWMRAYVEHVIVPAIERAERDGRAARAPPSLGQG